MHSTIQPFNFEGNQFRTIEIDSEPWFVLGDVCKVLEIRNVGDAKNRLDQADIGTTDVWSEANNRNYRVAVVNESGLYDVILDSRKPQAKEFRRWITSEVIPSIRKTGSYGTPAPALGNDELLARAVLAADGMIKELKATNLEQAEEIQAVTTENTALKGGDGIRIKDFIKTYFTSPNERMIFEWFYIHSYLIDGRMYDPQGRSQRSGNGPRLRWDHMHPTFTGRKYFKLVPKSNGKGNASTKVIPERALDLVALLVAAPDLRVQMTEEGRAAVDELQDINPHQLRLLAGELKAVK